MNTEETNKDEFTFPKEFFWGAATSAHQVEGDNNNDWTVWEKSQKRIATLKEAGENPADFISGKACDSYNKYNEDFDIAHSLGHNMHRVSIEWSRIEPEEGRFDDAALQHYINIVKSLREQNIEPLVTLWHFTNPIWFQEAGGFTNKRSPELFRRYAGRVVDNLKQYVRYWATFNEATTVYAGAVHIRGSWPPQKRSIFKWFKFRNNIKKAHILTYRTIHDIYTKSKDSYHSQVLDKDTSHNQHSPTSKMSENTTTLYDVPSTSHNVEPRVFVGAVENNLYWLMPQWCRQLGLGRAIDYFINHWLWLRTLPQNDYLGLNYYTVRRLFGTITELPEQFHQPEFKRWEIHAEGLYRVILSLRKLKKPIIITENGIADSKDKQREWFIRGHISWIAKALEDGVDVRGYLYWSLLDNFEWADGFRPQFGLVSVDRKTLKRTIRPSARAYAKIIKEGKIALPKARIDSR